MPDRYIQEIEEFERRDRETPPPSGAVLFLGSSTIRLWSSLEEDFPSVAVINRGFGGSEIEDCIRYGPRIVVPCKPRLIVFYAGDNDLAGGKTPEKVFTDYKRLVVLLHRHLPKIRIVFISIKPSPSRMHLMADIRKANFLIREFSLNDERLAYVDIFSQMLARDGVLRKELFLEDGLHMNRAGYALWTRAVRPFVFRDELSGG